MIKLIPVTSGLSITINSKKQVQVLLKDLECAIAELHGILWEDYSPNQRKRYAPIMAKADLNEALDNVKKKGNNTNVGYEWD